MDDYLNNIPEEKKEKSIIEIILYYLTILLKYKWFIIIFTSTIGAGVLIFLVITSLLPPDQSPLPNVYSASIILYIQSEGNAGLESILSSMFQDSPNAAFMPGIEVGEIAIALIYSGSFLDLLIEDLNIVKRFKIEGATKTSIRKFVSSKIQIHYDRARRMLRISWEDIDPAFTAEAINVTAKHLMNWFSEEGGTKKANMKKLLENKIVTVSEEISKLETQIQKFQRKYGILTANELATIHSDMTRDLYTRLTSIDLEIKNHSKLVKVEDTKLRRLRVERQNILEMIEQIEMGETGTGREIPAKRSVPDLLLEFNQLEMNLTIQSNIYETLLEQYEVLKLSAGVDNIFQIIEWAEIPEEKSGPSRSMILIIGVMAAFCVSVALVLIYNIIKKMKKS